MTGGKKGLVRSYFHCIILRSGKNISDESSQLWQAWGDPASAVNSFLTAASTQDLLGLTDEIQSTATLSIICGHFLQLLQELKSTPSSPYKSNTLAP